MKSSIHIKIQPTSHIDNNKHANLNTHFFITLTSNSALVSHHTLNIILLYLLTKHDLYNSLQAWRFREVIPPT